MSAPVYEDGGWKMVRQRIGDYVGRWEKNRRDGRSRSNGERKMKEARDRVYRDVAFSFP